MNSLMKTQHAFIQHIKNPQAHPFDGGIEERRLKIYRDLVEILTIWINFAN